MIDDDDVINCIERAKRHLRTAAQCFDNAATPPLPRGLGLHRSIPQRVGRKARPLGENRFE